MADVRPPAVAGLFYSDDPDALAADVQRYLADAKTVPSGPAPKAVIVPHAGYVYSGPVAATAYAQVGRRGQEVERVLLLGPSHHVFVEGLAVPTVDAFVTPLGRVPLDTAALARALTLPQVHALDAPHRREHSLEVQLPFLQRTLGAFRLAPFCVGEASAEQVAEVLDLLWGGPETLIVVSSDLSHDHDYATARRLDVATTRRIEDLRAEDLQPDDACGWAPVRGLLLVARRRGLHAHTLDLRSSGDTAGPRDQVVGYGSYALA